MGGGGGASRQCAPQIATHAVRPITNPRMTNPTKAVSREVIITAHREEEKEHR